jgi:hypothetical protein
VVREGTGIGSRKPIFGLLGVGSLRRSAAEASLNVVLSGVEAA